MHVGMAGQLELKQNPDEQLVIVQLKEGLHELMPS